MNPNATLTFLKKITKKTQYLPSELIHLIYPEHCQICDCELSKYQKKICSFCFGELPFTNFESYKESTSLEELFWGRCKIQHSFALLYFEKGKTTQQLLHELKYNDKPLLGEILGEIIGKKLFNSDKWKEIDVLIPVPIHHLKAYKRGYNQSEKIASGISKTLNIPVKTGFLKKHINTKSQTKNNKISRWENVKDTFYINKIERYKHIALIDDVITTGSTLETIVTNIHKKYPDIRISIISLALTK